MATTIGRIEINGQEIPFIGKPKFKLGVRKREYKTDINGTTRVSETLDDSASMITFELDNQDKDSRDLMINFYKSPLTRNSEGTLIATITYDNDPFNPINLSGGAIEDLPEIEDGGTTTYTFKFNSYAETL
jgi:hypothetical protein